MKVHYVTGSRADFGLMQRCLEAINRDSGHELKIVVTGQHTNTRYGDTAAMVHQSGLPVLSEIPVSLTGQDGAEMATALAAELQGFVQSWQADRPDLVLILGDRGEMLAAAIAAVHLGIFVAHIHGGELSGTLDESFRHAISKLAHFHLVASRDSAGRLERMGENSDFIHVIGAPGLVGLTEDVEASPDWIARRFKLPQGARTALVVFHPVVQEADCAGAQIQTLVEAVRANDFAQVILRPNSDAGGAAIDAYLDTVESDRDVRIETHLDRQSYLRLMASCDLLIGNSSSGIIESASFGIPCVNVGSRQNRRLRNPNTVDAAEFSHAAIGAAIRRAMDLHGPFENLYGDGSADHKLLDVLQRLPMQHSQLSKQNVY